MHMKNEHFPGLYQAADRASLSAQRVNILLHRMYLGSLVLGSVVGASTSIATGSLTPYLHTAIAVILALGLLILWITRARRDDKVWFDCRAIAESTKTATWRFMMVAPPFLEDNLIEERFISELREIREARPDSSNDIAGQIDANSSAITTFMKEMRARSFEERKAFYVEFRVHDQKKWYSNKGNMNSRSGTRWFWMTAMLQGLAVAIAVIEASSGGIQINVVPVLTTCAAAIVAWNQMKRYSELAQSYALAAQELEELNSIADSLTDEGKFPQLVEQVEEAISREHTMWCARRDVHLKVSSGPK